MYIYQLTRHNSIRHRLEIRRMGSDVIPRDKSWQVIVPFVVSVGAFCVEFVRWWLCV